MKVYQNIVELVGKTPLLQLNNYMKKYQLKANLIAKLEKNNPGGSVKDRIAKEMIIDAEEKGLLKPGSTIIEPTSGNTGIGLAYIGLVRGYSVIIVMPDTMSIERRKTMSAYGAKLVLTSGSLGMKGAIAEAERLQKELPDSFIPAQFDNKANPQAHYKNTGPEIYEDLNGQVDILVSGIGTGGTITGAGTYLKERNPNIKIIAVEPVGSPVLSKGESGSHKIQGIGAGFIPAILNTKIYDEVITVSDDEALKTAREIVKTDGVFVGISSGAALWAAAEVAKRPENSGKNIVVILPDGGDRYLSTALIDEEVK